MGIIDKAIYSFSCPKCGEVEEQTIRDTGSGYGGSCWDYGVKFSKFDSTWDGGGIKEPQLQAVSCKKCGNVDIEVNSKYRV